MVSLDSSITVDQHIDMAKSFNSPIVPYSKQKQINQILKNKRISTFPNQLNIPACERSRYAVIDVIILIVVIGASGFLLYPFVKILAQKTYDLGEEFIDVMSEEIVQAPMVFACLGLGFLFSTVALVIIAVYTDRDCGRPGCRGLRKHAEFDIQLESDECVKKSTYLAKSGILEKGFLDLSRDYYRELESELKKLAPVNGKAVLVFRAKCGCSVGKMEVSGPKKFRKVKK